MSAPFVPCADASTGRPWYPIDDVGVTSVEIRWESSDAVVPERLRLKVRFYCPGHAQDGAFIKVLSQDLESNGQSG